MIGTCCLESTLLGTTKVHPAMLRRTCDAWGQIWVHHIQVLCLNSYPISIAPSFISLYPNHYTLFLVPPFLSLSGLSLEFVLCLSSSAHPFQISCLSWSSPIPSYWARIEAFNGCRQKQELANPFLSGFIGM